MITVDSPHVGYFWVSKELLIEALHLPKDTEIIEIDVDSDTPKIIRVVVQHPDIPDVFGGSTKMLLNPQYHTVTDGDGWWHAVKFAGWYPEQVIK